MKTTNHKSRTLWRAVSLTAIAATLLLLFGFVYALNDLLIPRVIPLEASELEALPAPALTPSGDILITALGDSLTKGTGDSTGQGYVRQVMHGLASANPEVKVSLINNLAINGMRADQLAERLLEDAGTRYAVQQANLILLTIGGNDLFQFANGFASQQHAESIDLDRMAEQLGEGTARLQNVFATLYELNPDAVIVYTSLYNPFYDVPELRAGSLQVQEWNRQAYQYAHEYPNIKVVPTYDLFEAQIEEMLASDHFHPNHEGYKQISARILQVLRNFVAV